MPVGFSPATPTLSSHPNPRPHPTHTNARLNAGVDTVGVASPPVGSPFGQPRRCPVSSTMRRDVAAGAPPSPTAFRSQLPFGS
jgi:hypothetical protein